MFDLYAEAADRIIAELVKVEAANRSIRIYKQKPR